MSSPALPILEVKPPWQACVMVCRKCPKRGGGKKRDAKRFLSELRDAVRERFGKKRSRVIEVGCLDLCPKGRITVALGSPAGPLRVLLAEPSASPESILAALEGAPVRP